MRSRLIATLLVAVCLHGCADEPTSVDEAKASVTDGAGATDPATVPVTYENLYQRDALWPFHVMLTEDWRPEGFEGERFGWGLGVLVRVEPSGDLRVDFSRLGRHTVPARVTNVIEEANRIRLGELQKMGPNFVLAVVNKLIDPTSDPIEYVRPQDVGEIGAYLIVAADPIAPGFRELASALGPIAERRDLMLVLFPQGEPDDAKILERCREVGWTHPLLFPRFSEPYTRSILGDDLELPTLMLQSPEGRVLHTAVWTPDMPGGLARAVEQALGAVSAKAADPTAHAAAGDGLL